MPNPEQKEMSCLSLRKGRQLVNKWCRPLDRLRVAGVRYRWYLVRSQPHLSLCHCANHSFWDFHPSSSDRLQQPLRLETFGFLCLRSTVVHPGHLSWIHIYIYIHMYLFTYTCTFSVNWGYIISVFMVGVGYLILIPAGCLVLLRRFHPPSVGEATLACKSHSRPISFTLSKMVTEKDTAEKMRTCLALRMRLQTFGIYFWILFLPKSGLSGHKHL